MSEQPRKAPKTFRDRFEDYRNRSDQAFYWQAMSFDVAELAAKGMQACKVRQKELAALVDKRESQISRILNGENSKLSTIAQVLVPLGIIPKIVDEREWNRLRMATEAKATESATAVAKDIGSGANGTSRTIGTANGPDYQIRVNENIGYSAGVDAVRRAAPEVVLAESSGRADAVGAAHSMLCSSGDGEGGTFRYTGFLPSVPGTVFVGRGGV